jgi:uncharacterized protein with ParB-like and HNH nuclease domain
MGSIANNIQSFVRTLKEMLDGKKYQVDYFQREYKWERKHIEQLLVDLEASFMANFVIGHTIEDVSGYNCYYLGPVVMSDKNTVKSIVDGQQRLTSLTLLLIYLNNSQKNSEEKEELESLIYSKKYGRKSYNIEVPDRTKVLESLFNESTIAIEDETDESILNMVERYNDISSMFSSDLLDERLPMFIDWLKEKVVFVEIIAYTDENAYTIFETMNDRGLNLTPTEMLKGYILTNVKDVERISELNELWKKQLTLLHRYTPQEDLEFMKAWMRGLYADTIRQSTKGAENEDFEKIGTRFHTWIKDNSKKLNLKDSDSYYYFVKGDFQFYSTVYLKVIESTLILDENFEDLYFSYYWGIASSLSLPVILAPINKLDDQDTITQKIQIVSKFLDIYTVARMLNKKSINQSSIRYFIYSLVKDIRNKGLQELKNILSFRLNEMSEKIEGIDNFNYYSADKKFIHYLFARVIYYLENQVFKKDISFDDLMVTRKKNRFVIASLMGYDYDKYSDGFVDEDEFITSIASIGNYVLIPNMLAQEYANADDIHEKLKTLKKSYVSTLCNDSLNNDKSHDLAKWGFAPVKSFTYENIENRRHSLANVIKEIWSSELI